MKTLILNIFGMLILFGLYECSDNSDNANDKTLVDTKWDLQSFEIVGAGKSDKGSEDILLIFKEESTLEGQSSNNSYGSVYEAGIDDSLYIDVIATTKVGTPEGSRYSEYLDALANSSSYEIEGDKLRIFYDRRTKALNFKAE
jgi:heat shock protein HslJ